MIKLGKTTLAICIILLVGSCGIASAKQVEDGTLGYTNENPEKYTPSKSIINQLVVSPAIHLGVWWPRYAGDLPPYGDLASAGIEAVDVVDLNASTLQNLDVVYIGRGAFYLHAGEGNMDINAVKDWVRNGGAIIGESESVIYDSVVTLGVDWSPQLSNISGVWSNQPGGWDYVAGDINISLNPEHPISNGLPATFYTTVYSMEDAAYLDPARNPTAQIVGTVASILPGIPPIIASSYGSGRAVYFPYCPDGYTDWSSVGGQNLEKLFINAVKWAAGQTPTAGSISGFKINDTNGNGKWDAGENGLQGWKIKLTGIVGMGTETSVLNLKTTTNADGFYMFANLPAGRYVVMEELQGGFVLNGSPIMSIMLAKGEISENNNFFNRPISSLFSINIR